MARFQSLFIDVSQASSPVPTLISIQHALQLHRQHPLVLQSFNDFRGFGGPNWRQQKYSLLKFDYEELIIEDLSHLLVVG